MNSLDESIDTRSLKPRQSYFN